MTANTKIKPVGKIKYGDVTVQIVEMTPEWAQDILDDNENRTVREKRASTISDLMKSGEWQFNGDTIVLDKHGTLRDGQHRLQGCVHSGTTFTAILVEGVEPVAQRTMDIGSRRTPADALHLAGEEHASNVAAVLSTVYSWEMAGMLVRAKNNPLTPMIAVDLLGEHPRVREYAKNLVVQNPTNVPGPSAFAAVMYLIDRACSNLGPDEMNKFNRFYEGVVKGIGIDTTTDPRFVLRNRLTRVRDELGSGNEAAAACAWLTVRGWKYYFEDNDVTRIQLGGAGDFSLYSPRHWLEIPGDKFRFSKASEQYVDRVMTPPNKTTKVKSTRSKKQ